MIHLFDEAIEELRKIGRKLNARGHGECTDQIEAITSMLETERQERDTEGVKMKEALKEKLRAEGGDSEAEGE